MRKIIIDTDTGSDDAVAILMALRDPSVQVLAVTTVCGNVNMEQATINAFRSIDAARTYVPPVYKGAYRPLMRDAVTAENVHGQDGMGDMGLPVPDMQAETEHAVEAILRLVKENPGEIEIVALGPATNLALAMMKDPETMKQVKHIYSMGSGGYEMCIRDSDVDGRDKKAKKNCMVAFNADREKLVAMVKAALARGEKA